MSEVDAVMPEGIVARQTTVAANVPVVSKEQLENGLNKTASIAADKVEAMEVDGALDTEEDDSQITTSTENGGAGIVDAEGEASKLSDDKDTAPSSAENTKESAEEPHVRLLKSTAVNEDSSNACDGVAKNSNSGDDDEEESRDSLAKGDDSCLSDSQQKQLTVASDETEVEEAVSQDGTTSNGKATPNSHGGDEASMDDVLKTDKSALVPMDAADEEDPFGSVPQPENGVVEKAARRNDTETVDLDDDSDNEDGDEVEELQKAVPKKVDETSNGGESNVGLANIKIIKPRSICSDSDGAVVIGSDSESEAPQPAAAVINTIPKSTAAPAPPADDTQIIDDDDDDCVVIEDDAPSSNNTASDLSKRKSLAMDAANNSDDSQPPSKRRAVQPISQIAIKDARSLMPQEAAPFKSAIIYPVNITPAPSLTTEPPKLVPVSGSSSSAATTLGSSLSGMSSNANLLPGLTDDMFVLEAPSFIVPYIYEKPPAANLKDIVREIESKYSLSKEDLADAEKVDEFDMMTEQNKADKEAEKIAKKKKKKRGANDEEEDESWSEADEDDDEEEEDEYSEDSEGTVRTKVLIKEATDDMSAIKSAIKPITPSTAVVATSATSSSVTNATTLNKPGLENYFESPLGKFFMEIGVGQVQEFVQTDLIKLQKRKMRKSLGKNITDFERAIAALSGNLEASKKKNSAFKFTMKRCEFCNFKSESALSMANHYETPHMNGILYKCNFCIFEIRNATEIVYHMEAVHNIKARLIKPLPYHQCPNCGFEDNGKAKLARHQPVCAKKFRPEFNLAPPNDWEAPAKIPRIKPRHGLVGTATAYQAMTAQAAAQKAAFQQQQQQLAQARTLQAAAIAAQNAAIKLRSRAPPVGKPGPNGGVPMRGSNTVRNPMATNVVLPNNYQLAAGQLIQSPNAMAKKTLSGQPSISITPLPRQSATAQATSPSTSKMPPAGMKPGQSPGGSKAQFVICEICDGYIKDLEQLRNHMQWMHKVKIHPKMIYNRPPLNCQKCQFRFFTDQGLERHLLGSHGLVTSSMQEAANKGKDAGRCPVCGRMYQWKLLNHVSRDHHMTLKPAHLSYKCTVCTATFGMYKQFETHVYTAHSTVAKKAMDGKKNNTAAAPAAGSSTISQRSSSGLSASNDSLLKPLKINDEITIIPQPASKPRITNMESHVID